MQLSKKPIENQIGWLSSHATGIMKAHSLTEAQEDFWQVILNVTKECDSLRRKLKDLEGRCLGGPQ